MILNNEDHPIVFFDGLCNLCNRTIQFIIRKDKKKLFLFAPLQSEQGKTALQNLNFKNQPPPDSIVLLYKGRYFVKSGAALRIFYLLGGGWKLAYGLLIIPPFIRDSIYGWIARNRYKWFGKKDTCMIPTPELLNRFMS